MGLTKALHKHFRKGGFARSTHSKVAHTDGHNIIETDRFDMAVIKQLVADVQKKPKQPRHRIC
jgi:hypothetical protein